VCGFLAGMVPAMVATVLVVWIQWHAVAAARDGSVVGYREAIQGAAATAVIETPGDFDPGRLYDLLPRWRRIAVLRTTAEDEVQVVANWGTSAGGAVRARDRVVAAAPFGSGAEILPDGHAAVASALRNRQLEVVAILYAESAEPVPPRFLALRDLPAPLLVLLLGALLAWYLAARIKRPIDDLQHRAEAALRGQGLHHLASSVETAEVTSAVDQLAAAYGERAAREHPDDDER